MDMIRLHTVAEAICIMIIALSTSQVIQYSDDVLVDCSGDEIWSAQRLAALQWGGI